MDARAKLEGLQPYTIHGAPYFRVFFSLPDNPDEIIPCQLPEEAVDPGLRPGDECVVTYLLRTVMRVSRVPSGD